MVIIGVWYVHGGLLYYFLYLYVYLKVSVIKSEKKFEFLYKNLEQSGSYHYDFHMIYTYHKQSNMLP